MLPGGGRGSQVAKMGAARHLGRPSGGSHDRIWIATPHPLPPRLPMHFQAFTTTAQARPRG